MALYSNCNVQFGHYYGPINSCRKRTYFGVTVNGSLVNSSVGSLTATIRVNAEDLRGQIANYEYCYLKCRHQNQQVLADLSGYYFVEEVRSVTSAMLEVDLKKDICMSYVSTFLTSDRVIERTTCKSVADPYAEPLYVPQPNYTKKWEVEYHPPLSSTGGYVLVTLNTHTAAGTGIMEIHLLDNRAWDALINFLKTDFSSQASFIVDAFLVPCFDVDRSFKTPANSMYIGDKLYTITGTVYSLNRFSRNSYTIQARDLKLGDTTYDPPENYLCQMGTIGIKMTYGGSTQIDPREMFNGNAFRTLTLKIIIDWATGSILYKIDTGMRILNFTCSFGTRLPLALSTASDIRRDQAISVAGVVGSAAIGVVASTAIPAISAASSAGQTALSIGLSSPTATPVTGTAGTDLAGAEWVGYDSSLGFPSITVTGWGVDSTSVPEEVVGWYCGKSNVFLPTDGKPQYGWRVSGTIYPQEVPSTVANEIERLFTEGIYI